MPRRAVRTAKSMSAKNRITRKNNISKPDVGQLTGKTTGIARKKVVSKPSTPKNPITIPGGPSKAKKPTVTTRGKASPNVAKRKKSKMGGYL